MTDKNYKIGYLDGLAEGRKEGYEQGKNNERELQCGKKNYEKDIAKLEKENARLSKMLEMAIDFIEQEDMQCKLCSFYFSCRENCPYGDETPISDIIRAELEKRVENEK